MRVASEINLTPQEREELIKLTRSGLTSVRLAQLAPVVGIAANGLNNYSSSDGEIRRDAQPFYIQFHFLDPAGNSYPPNPNSVRRLHQISGLMPLAFLGISV
jgi:hypothetical protein